MSGAGAFVVREVLPGRRSESRPKQSDRAGPGRSLVSPQPNQGLFVVILAVDGGDSVPIALRGRMPRPGVVK